MTQAVCFKCGEIKWGAFNRCGKCGATPKSDDELLLSLACSDHYSDLERLQQLGNAIKAGRPIQLHDSLKKSLAPGIKEFKKLAGIDRNVTQEPAYQNPNKQPNVQTKDRAPIWPVLIAPLVTLLYYLAMKLAFIIDVRGFSSVADNLIEKNWGHYWVYRTVMELSAFALGTFVAAGLARGWEKVAGIVGGITVALLFILPELLSDGIDYSADTFFDCLVLIGAPLIGSTTAVIAREMNAWHPTGFAGINRFHLLWLWFTVLFYIGGLIGLMRHFFTRPSGILDNWIGGSLKYIGLLVWLIPGYYGLALLSGHKGDTKAPIVRNLLGVAVLFLPVVIGAVMYLLIGMTDDQ